MPKINPRISSLDDLLGVAREVENTAAAEDKPAQPGNNEIQMLSPEIIRGFRGHPFRLYEGERLNDLVESISENGVLVPAIVRKIEPDENGFEYEMLAGHNRQNAATEQMICEILMALEQNAVNMGMEYDDCQKAMGGDLSKAAKKEWYLRHKDRGMEP